MPRHPCGRAAEAKTARSVHATAAFPHSRPSVVLNLMSPVDGARRRGRGDGAQRRPATCGCSSGSGLLFFWRSARQAVVGGCSGPSESAGARSVADGDYTVRVTARGPGGAPGQVQRDDFANRGGDRQRRLLADVPDLPRRSRSSDQPQGIADGVYPARAGGAVLEETRLMARPWTICRRSRPRRRVRPAIGRRSTSRALAADGLRPSRRRPRNPARLLPADETVTTADPPAPAGAREPAP